MSSTWAATDLGMTSVCQNSTGVSFSFTDTNALEPGAETEVSLLPDDIAVKEALDSLITEGVGGGRKDTNLVRVSFEHVDRLVARDFINALMDTYMDFSLEWKTLRADRSAVFIKG